MLNAELEKPAACSGFLLGFGLQPLIWQELHPTGLTQPDLPHASAEFCIHTQPCMQGSVAQARFLLFLGSLRLFPSMLFAGACHTGCCVVPLVTRVLAPLEQGTVPCKGRDSRNRDGVLFSFLVLTTSGKNLDENRGAAGMIEEGFFFLFFIFF